MSYIPPNPNGSATSANSAPVVIASDQAALPLPTGAATSSAQSTGNTSLGTIATNTTGVSTAANQATANTSLSSIATNTGNSSTSANQTNGTQQTKVTDGTNIVNVFAPAGGNSNNALLIAPTGYSTATLTLNSGSPATAWFDLLMYPSFSVEILTNTTPATLTFQTSGDGSETNVRTTTMQDSQNASSNAVTNTTSATGTYYGGRTGRYFRISSNNGAGTTTLVITFYTSSFSMGITVGGAYTGSTTGSAVPAQAFYVGMDGTSGNLSGLMSSANLGNTAASNNGLLAISQYLFNGTTNDKVTNNTTGALIAAGTTSTQSAIALTTYNARSLILVINITVATVSTLTVTVNGASSSSYTYLLGSSAALASISTNTLMFGPGLPATANASFNIPLPRNIQVTATATGTCTYGIDYILSV